MDLPAGVAVLPAGELPPAPAGTLFVLGAYGGMRVAPTARFRLVFGRNEPYVHVSVGVDDPYVSREQGHISRIGSQWILRNVGRVPIRLPGSRLV
ncbi:hypothetical protein GCM10009765_75380 [Fodinicola feengrottensis]|uniref:FHA domain-containing protein n=1 Tax=Fodinicola feengrottensis TaxID=435914 RepID=A0ABP4V0G5_9ACTN